ncbi:hypothetical protein GCM10027170_24420 [Aliiglaciecola aliphaticivorans]
MPNFVQAQQSLFVAIGWDKPPYVMNNAKAGFEVELLRDVMQTIGYEVQFVQIPYGRSYDIFNMNNIDAVATLSSKRKAKQLYLSNAYIQYQNVVVTLASSNIQLDSVADMSEISTVGFQSAYKLLGADFTKMTSINPAYREIPDQGRQLKLLFSKKTQAIVLDVNIFNHLSRTIIKKANQQPVVIHQLFSPNMYRVGFRNPEIQVKFDQGLTAYLTSERYVELSKKYHFYSSNVSTESHATPSFTEE